MKLRTVVIIAAATLSVPVTLLLFIAWAVGKE